MKSNLTVAELIAQAMLLGLHYDPADHSFNDIHGGCLDADSLKPFNPFYYPGAGAENMHQLRIKQVKRGTIGAADDWRKKQADGSRT